MRIIYYNSLDDRKQKLKNLDVGESLIHDDFLDENGEATDGTKGKLTLDVVISTPDPNFMRMKELRQKLKDDSITFNELKEYLRLKDQRYQ